MNFKKCSSPKVSKTIIKKIIPQKNVQKIFQKYDKNKFLKILITFYFSFQECLYRAATMPNENTTCDVGKLLSIFKINRDKGGVISEVIFSLILSSKKLTISMSLNFLLKPNYSKKQCSSSSFLLT